MDVLVKVMRNPGATAFSMAAPRQRTPQPIHYRRRSFAGSERWRAQPPASWRRLIVTARRRPISTRTCCTWRRARWPPDPPATATTTSCAAARCSTPTWPCWSPRCRRAGIDISAPGPQRFKMQISDGRQTDFGQVAVHWEIARMVLDDVKAGVGRPVPGRDEMVRQWYRATAAWMQQVEDHDTVHLDRAREIFPADPDILFLSGASTKPTRRRHSERRAIGRSAVRGIVRRRRRTRGELRQAEGILPACARDQAGPRRSPAAAWPRAGAARAARATPRESSVRRWRRSTKTCCATTASCFSARKKSRCGQVRRRVRRVPAGGRAVPGRAVAMARAEQPGAPARRPRRGVARAAADVRPALDGARARRSVVDVSRRAGDETPTELLDGAAPAVPGGARQ